MNDRANRPQAGDRAPALPAQQRPDAPADESVRTMGAADRSPAGEDRPSSAALSTEAVIDAWAQQSLSLPQCARLFGTSTDTIRRILASAGMARRQVGRSSGRNGGANSDTCGEAQYRALYDDLRRMADRGATLPRRKAMDRHYRFPVAAGLAWLQSQGLVVWRPTRCAGTTITIVASGKSIGTAAGNREKGKPHTIRISVADRYGQLYAALCAMADRGDRLPSHKLIKRRFHVDAGTALNWLQSQGRIRYSTNQGTFSTVMILASGQVIQTRRPGRKKGRNAGHEKFSAAWQPTPTREIWGVLADDVIFLRKQGDVIGRAGTAARPLAKLNGVVVALAELVERARRIRERQQRMRRPDAGFAAIY